MSALSDFFRHGRMTHLDADDHYAVYFNQTRGDARYLQLSGGNLTDQLSMTKDGQAAVTLASYSDTVSSSNTQRRFKGTQASPSAVTTGIGLGNFIFQGALTSSTVGNAGAITVNSADNFDSSQCPGRMVFQTTASGSTTLTTRMMIRENGNVQIASPASDTGEKLQVNGDAYIQGVVNIKTGNTFQVNGVDVIGARKTGWGTPTGTLSRAAFDQSTVTLPQLAQRVAALVTDLLSHGLIGA